MISLSDIKMRNKLMLMLVLPLVGMIYFSVVSLTNSVRTNSEMGRLQENMVLAGKISAAVHEIQKERGMSAGYLGSKGKKFASKLNTHRNDADKKIADLNKFLESFDSRELKRPLEDASSKLLTAINLRSRISNLSVSTRDAVATYSAVNTAYLGVIGKIANASPDGNTARMASAYYNFLQSKERAGIERAVLTGVFTRQEFGPGMFQKFTSLVMSQSMFEKRFTGLATDDMEALYRNTMNNPVIGETERMRKVALSSATLGNSVLTIDAAKWFAKQTEKINLMKKVDDGIADILSTYAHHKKGAARTTLIISVVVSVFSLLAAIVATYFIQRNIITRLAKVEAVAEAVAGGDISEVEVLKGSDEISHLLQSMRFMTSKLAQVG